MFKSKTDFNAFDKTNVKVENPKITKVKGLAKAGTKKLTGKIGERTFYHLIMEYFVDDKGTIEGHFLDFGENKKLRRHFEQVEMKSGKLDKSMSETPKKACAGEAYVEEINGKKVVHFEPIKGSKIPKAQWPKILKALKPSLNGLKAVVILNGEVIGADEEENEVTEPTGVNEVQTDVNSKSVAAGIKELISGITKTLKKTLPKVVIPNIKANKVSQEDVDIINDLFDELRELKLIYKTANFNIQQKIEKHYDSIMNQVSKLEKVRTTLNSLLSVAEGESNISKEEDTEEVKRLKELLEYAIKETDVIWESFKKTKDEIAEVTSQVIKGGDELLEVLY